MTALTHQLDRTIVIEAPPASVFKYFTDPMRWAAWWGAGSTIDARPGGRVLVRYPDGTEAAGEVDRGHAAVADRLHLRLRERRADRARRIARDDPAGAGGARHAPAADARLRRRGGARPPRAGLALPALALRQRRRRRDPRATPAALVDAWFAAWAEPDEAARASGLAAIASPDVRMRDRFSCVDGAAELTLHIGAAQRFMPGMRLQRAGRRAPLPGHGARRLDGRRPRRRAARPGHQRIHARSRRSHRVGHRVLGVAVSRSETAG